MTTRTSFVKFAAASGLAGATAPLFALSLLHIGAGTYSYHSLSVDDMIIQLNALHIREQIPAISHPVATTQPMPFANSHLACGWCVSKMSEQQAVK